MVGAVSDEDRVDVEPAESLDLETICSVLEESLWSLALGSCRADLETEGISWFVLSVIDDDNVEVDVVEGLALQAVVEESLFSLISDGSKAGLEADGISWPGLGGGGIVGLLDVLVAELTEEVTSRLMKESKKLSKIEAYT